MSFCRSISFLRLTSIGREWLAAIWWSKAQWSIWCWTPKVAPLICRHPNQEESHHHGREGFASGLPDHGLLVHDQEGHPDRPQDERCAHAIMQNMIEKIRIRTTKQREIIILQSFSKLCVMKMARPRFTWCRIASARRKRWFRRRRRRRRSDYPPLFPILTHIPRQGQLCICWSW